MHAHLGLLYTHPGRQRSACLPWPTAQRLVLAAVLGGVLAALLVGCTPSPPPPTAGEMLSWGTNLYDELGASFQGSESSTPVPLSLGGTGKAIAVSAGSNFSLALEADGSVWAWGRNNYGELGSKDSTTGQCADIYPDDICLPQPVQIAGISHVTAISAGVYFSLALEADGSVWAWGSNEVGLLGPNGPINVGNCPSPAGDFCSPTPVPVPLPHRATAIAAGSSFSLALLDDGTVWAWGINVSDELGPNSPINQTCPTGGPTKTLCSQTPVQVAPFPDRVIAISAGNGFGLALVANRDQVYAWGDDFTGQLGPNGPIDPCPGSIFDPCGRVPRPVGGISHVTAISAGNGFGLALEKDGSVWAWGDNSLGELGVNGPEQPGGCPHLANKAPVDLPCSPTPVPVAGLKDVTAISAGSNFSLALEADGSVWAWGRNSSGQLGNGAAIVGLSPFSPFPMPVVGPQGGTLRRVITLSASKVISPRAHALVTVG
jgi:alpha-tubulin suppressor-like RCC1 family protein